MKNKLYKTIDIVKFHAITEVRLCEKIQAFYGDSLTETQFFRLSGIIRNEIQKALEKAKKEGQ